MNSDNRVWLALLLVGAALIGIRCWMAGELVGKGYVKVIENEFVNLTDRSAIDPDTDPQDIEDQWVTVKEATADGIDVASIPDDRKAGWTSYAQADPTDYYMAVEKNPNQTEYLLSPWRTLGIWFAAFLTLGIFSFLYKDNPFYKTAEAIFIGTSAAYWMVVAFWTTLVPNLFGNIAPEVIQGWAMPGLKEPRNLFYLVPLALGVMLVWRLAPVGGWIARWPLALFIGVFCGLRMTGYLHGDFLNQIRNTIVPLFVLGDNGSFDPWGSLQSLFLVVGVLCCLVYFFFSFEHKGFVGHTARVGIWVLMITFGAGFGYTVMGRIALLAIRLEFLFDDWLWLIDPTDKRLPG